MIKQGTYSVLMKEDVPMIDRVAAAKRSVFMWAKIQAKNMGHKYLRCEITGFSERNGNVEINYETTMKVKT